MWFIGVEVEEETSSPPPKKNPGSALALREFSSVVAVTIFVSGLLSVGYATEVA